MTPQRYIAKHQIVEAVRCALLDENGNPTGERAVSIQGVMLLDEAIFAELYEPAEVHVTDAAEPKRRGRRPGPKPGPKPAVEPKQRRKPGPKPKQIAAVPEPVERKLTISDAIRQAVAEKPRTNIEIHARVAELGVNAESNSVSQILCQLRSKNECYKDEDLKWYPAVRSASRANGAHA